MAQRKPTIGLAGGIGSGKSLVARQLQSLGAVVVDADQIAQAALDRPEVRRQLLEWWGPDVLDQAGLVDRRRVAERVFTSPEQRKRLESLIHPLVAQERDRIAAAVASDSAAKALVIDAPLLFEAGLDKQCDAVIYVDTPRQQRLQRVKQQRGWDAAELDRREKSQWALDTKRQLAHHVVENRSSEADCLSQIRSILTRILESSGSV